MINEPIKNDQNYPPAASRGGDNAYYLKGCDVVQRSPSYASCLFKIEEHQAGRSDDYPTHADCQDSIRSGRCQALAMRQEEQLKGTALYYFPRNPPQALTIPGAWGERITNLTPANLIPKDPPPPGRSRFATTKKTPAAPSDAVPKIDDGGFADAINAAMDASTTPVEAAPTTFTKAAAPVAATTPARPTMQAGESPLQYARRIAALNKPQ